MDLRPPLESALDAFAPSEPAVVTVPGEGPVETRAFWLPPTTEDVPGGDLRRSESHRVLVLPKSTVPQAPRGTIVSIPESEGADASEWRVDSLEHDGHDEHRVIVVPHEAES